MALYMKEFKVVLFDCIPVDYITHASYIWPYKAVCMICFDCIAVSDNMFISLNYSSSIISIFDSIYNHIYYIHMVFEATVYSEYIHVVQHVEIHHVKLRRIYIAACLRPNNSSLTNTLQHSYISSHKCSCSFPYLLSKI